MAKTKTAFVCTDCDSEYPRWFGYIGYDGGWT